MQKINFENKPSTVSPINATNLNALQDNVENAINELVSSLEFKDYTSQCTFKNCTLKSGKILKKEVKNGSLKRKSTRTRSKS